MPLIDDEIKHFVTQKKKAALNKSNSNAEYINT